MSAVKLSVRDFNFLLSHVDNAQSKFVWVRDPSLQQQLYISIGYEKIWGKRCEELYNYPKAWQDNLHENENKKTKRVIPPNTTEADNAAYYRIRTMDSQISWLKDTCFQLYDQTGQLRAVAGIGEVITQSQWEYELKAKSGPELADIFTQDRLLSIIHNEFNLSSMKKTKLMATEFVTDNGKEIKFSARETECLSYITTGLPVKLIADKLNISPRTVECHINNIKEKLECRTRCEIISKVNGKNINF